MRSCLPASRKAVRRFKYACHTVVLCEQTGACFDAVPPVESCGVRQPVPTGCLSVANTHPADCRKAREQHEQEEEEMLWAGSVAPRRPNIEVMHMHYD